MTVKRHLTKIVIFGVAGMAFLTQPVQSYEGGLVSGLLTVSAVPLGTNVPSPWIIDPQKYIHQTINLSAPQKVEVPPPHGASIRISSIPVPKNSMK